MQTPKVGWLVQHFGTTPGISTRLLARSPWYLLWIFIHSSPPEDESWWFGDLLTFIVAPLSSQVLPMIATFSHDRLSAKQSGLLHDIGFGYSWSPEDEFKCFWWDCDPFLKHHHQVQNLDVDQERWITSWSGVKDRFGSMAIRTAAQYKPPQEEAPSQNLV